MKLDEMHALAMQHVADLALSSHDVARGKTLSPLGARLVELSQAVIELLGVGFPCGFEEPSLTATASAHPLVRFDGSAFSPDEAHGIGLALIRKAQEAGT